MKKLDPEEQALLDAFDSGTLTQVANVDSELMFVGCFSVIAKRAKPLETA